MVRHEKTMCVIMCHVIFLMWMVQLTFFWRLFLPNFVICCVGKPQGLPPCWFVISVPRVGTWDASCHLCRKYQLTNGFSHNAFSWPRYLFLWLNSKGFFSFLPMHVSHLAKELKGIIVRWLMMGFTFAFNLLVLSL
jgi:hypothetical protein